MKNFAIALAVLVLLIGNGSFNVATASDETVVMA